MSSRTPSPNLIDFGNVAEDENDLLVLDQYYTSESSKNFNPAEESDEQKNYMDDIKNIEEETCPSVIDSDESLGIDAIIFDRTLDTFEVEAEGSNSAHSVCPKSRMDLVLHKCKTNMTTIIDTSYLEFDTRFEESYSDLRIEIKRRAQNLFRRTIQEQSTQIYTKVLSEMGNLMTICELENSQKERSLVLFSNFMTDIDTIIENKITLIDHKSKIDKKISNVELLFQTIQDKSNINSVNELSDEGMELLILEDEITILKQDLDKINYVVREKTFENKFKGLEEKVNSIQGMKIIHDRLAALESVDELIEARLKIDIQTSEKTIMKRLNDDHKEKMAQTIAVRIETLEAVNEYLRQEFKLNEEEIMKRIKNDKAMFNQIIQERIREAIHLYTMEYDEKLKQRTYELLQHYEERLNKLVDTSIGLESTTEEIKKAAEEKIRSFEIENQKLKDSKNNQKVTMVIKETIIYDLKLMAAHHQSVASKLQENKIILEARVNDLKSERTKLENKIKSNRK
ncbi:hypothetical protein C2G38_2168699 [Gigaspora rosea]|uniref:Uncharacterized protein n=1 Tax=Gigaspora rosea TaxID=44941 RepID=A0A397VRG5_9GLOM|nr:hypothetical protein C2G38_2168699 [Gigaspora rosea]